MWTGGQGFFSSTITKEVGWRIKKTFAEKMQRAIQHDGPTIIIALGNVINVGKLSLHFLPDPGVSGVRSMGPGVSMSKNFVKLC